MADEADQASSPKPAEGKPRHTFGMPRGSVRAMLALCVAGSAYWLIANPELLKGPPYDGSFPPTLLSCLMLVLGYYFADRAWGGGEPADGRPPLWLPQGSVRALLILGFVAAVVVLVRSLPSAAEVFGMPIVGVIIQLFAFLLGRFGKRGVVAVRRKGRKASVRRFEDVKGAIAIAAGLGAVVVFCVPDLPMPPGIREEFERVFPSIVVFYFGSR